MDDGDDDDDDDAASGFWLLLSSPRGVRVAGDTDDVAIEGECVE